jgi:hypothetical protein
MGNTGRAKCCKGFWVPTILIHSRLSVLKSSKKKKKNMGVYKEEKRKRGEREPKEREDPGIGGQQRK